MVNKIMLPNTTWSYAELSHCAKQYGGPNMFLNAIEKSSRTMGRIDMIPIIAGTAVVVGGISSFVTFKVIKKKYEIKNKIDENKRIYLEGIKRG